MRYFAAILVLTLGLSAAPRWWTSISATGGSDSNPYKLGYDEYAPAVLTIHCPNYPITISGNAGLRLVKVKGFSIKPEVRVRGTIYPLNSEKNSFSFTEKVVAIRKGGWVSLAYLYVPKSTVRPLYDSDDNTEHFESYAGNYITLRAGLKALPPLWLSAEARRAMLYYNPNFLEYDSDQNRIGCGVKWNDKAFSTGVWYYFTDAPARAFDTQGETKATSDDGDASYQEDKLALSLRRNGRLSFGVICTYYRRLYQSEKPPWDDILHRGRRDSYYAVAPYAKYALSDKLSIKISSNYSRRHSESPYNPELPDIRGYERLAIKTTIEYSIAR